MYISLICLSTTFTPRILYFYDTLKNPYLSLPYDSPLEVGGWSTHGFSPSKAVVTVLNIT